MLLHGSTRITSLRSTPVQHGITDVTDLTRGHDVNLVSILPREIFEHIADEVFALTPPQKDYNGSMHSSKPRFAVVENFMSASPILHEIGIIRWVCVLTIRDIHDWKVALKWHNFIRELVCMDGVFDSDNQTVLQQFPHLHTVTIDSHNDVYKNALGRFSYRDVFSSLPPNVLQLEITCAHGPDLKIMEMVRACCPRIEALRLGRCSMFNRSTPCEFWLDFPLDHDAYMSSDGTSDYAHSVAQEIAALSQLKHLRLGVYLVPSTTVLAHRAYHIRNEPAPAPINWQQALVDAAGPHGVNGPPDVSQLVEFYYHSGAMEAEFGPDSCSFCRDAFHDQSKDFQRSASAVMKTIVPSLEIVEWMNWFTPFHLGVSRHDVRPRRGVT
ncbi:hypothetical protein RSOL_493180 [Rhizoctonia solani AG-3 Rhs1AP]|uniref:F-box-like domain protein n=1 Tax=Rhizoctonia solani AG-3 Rhs1AP TaxID=1086054 RepID=X8JPE7_9AGAM|nr:hypothetical protein RSOL_493180 [Rhizoctonia solani AG-3 Rhs1AP]